jgi:hypothetical protein
MSSTVSGKVGHCLRRYLIVNDGLHHFRFERVYFHDIHRDDSIQSLPSLFRRGYCTYTIRWILRT